MKSYEYNVLDYLLKPIEFSRFMVAVQKAAAHKNEKFVISEETISDGLFFTVNKKKARIAISELDKQLPNSFLRIHR